MSTAAPEDNRTASQPAPVAKSCCGLSWRLLESRAPWLLLLLAAAAFYYGSYYRHSFNFRDEGGTVVLGAQRLLEGQLPFKDVVLNYNVLWFYPVVALFKVVGVSFIALRVYCFALSTLTAVLAFLAVAKVSRRPWLGFLVALLPLLVPGMTFKNYMPLLAVANSFCLLQAAFTAPGSREERRATALGGLVLGLTFLIRIDLGAFFCIIWLGMHALRLFERAAPLARTLPNALAAMAITLGAVLVTHLPVYADARQRGFDSEFLAQYGSKYRDIRSAAFPKPAAAIKPALSASVLPISTSLPAAQTPAAAPQAKAENLRRGAWRDFVAAKDFEDRALVLLTYLPLLSLVPLVLWAVAAFLRAAFSGEPSSTRRPLAALVVLGGALTTFPQFFFFRPDGPHLSEFSPGFWVGAICAAILLGAHEGDWRRRPHWRQLPARLLLVVLGLHAAFYLVRALPDRWMGTIAARKNRTKSFHAENGVNVLLGSKEVAGLGAIAALIREHSKPGEYLVAYPYHPGFNVLANRPTYEKNVYVDNIIRTPKWDAEAIARFEEFKPAVIILSDWDINGNEASRFSVWATATKTWIQTHYAYQGTYLDWYEVYTRP